MAIITVSATRDFGNGDVRKLSEQSFDSEKLTPAQVVWLIERGAEESARNSFASDTPKKWGGTERAWLESRKKWDSWFDRLRAGEVLSSGRGGARLSLFDECLRDTIRDFFNHPKVKALLKEPLSAQALAKLSADDEAAANLASSVSSTGKTPQDFKTAWAESARKLEAQRTELDVDV